MPNALNYLIGTADFSLITGISTAPAAETDYDNATAMFGQIDSVGIQNQSESREHFGAYQGVKVLDAVHQTQHRLGYILNCKEVDPRMLDLLYYGTAGADTGTTPDYSTTTPLASPQSLEGFCRLRFFDGKSTTNPRFVHKDFCARVMLNNQPDFSDDDYFSFELKVDVLGTVGTVLNRKDT